MMTDAFIAFGSNLGDRAENLRQAARLLRENPRVDVLAASDIYETDPVGPADQGRFLNAVLKVETDLPPREFLDLLLKIERELGRVRTPGERWGPRVIDLDLLVFGDLSIDEPGLTIPHPRMHERLFVLIPLRDVAPELVVESTIDRLKRERNERIQRVDDAALIALPVRRPES